MTQRDTEGRVETRGATLRGSGRNPQERGGGVSYVTARKGHSGSEATRLMEAVVERGNMKAALKRVKANKGAAGVDEMSVDALLPY
jgi:RNA-directed DNA polymerase